MTILDLYHFLQSFIFQFYFLKGFHFTPTLKGVFKNLENHPGSDLILKRLRRIQSFVFDS